MENQTTISYKVFCIRIRLDLSPGNITKLLQVCSTNKKDLTSVFQGLSRGDIDPELLGNRELEGILGIEERSEKVFSSDSPIESRRQAVSYAESLNDVIKQGREFVRPIDIIGAFNDYGVYPALQALDYKLNIFGISAALITDNMELVVGATPPIDDEMPERLEKEYLLYKERGYDMGGEKPFEMYIPSYGRIMRFLPDAASKVATK